jgi:hypothetical protein
LSFLPVKYGYVAAMNRDELRSRAAALAPAIRQSKGRVVLYPQEPGGGTWIGGNSRGNLLALLNWYSMEPARPGTKVRSRGEIIPAIVGEETAEATELALRDLPLADLFPFRLFGFFPEERLIREWRWDTKALSVAPCPWDRHHWFSSSWSDDAAAAHRGMVCERAWQKGPSDPRIWLRKLHASHEPEPGPFSVCVHREDASTVSYTELHWGREGLEMCYLPGNPCQPTTTFYTTHLPAPLASSKSL